MVIHCGTVGMSTEESKGNRVFFFLINGVPEADM